VKAKDKGLTISKVHSDSDDSGTFCEQYVFRPGLGADITHFPKESVFGDLIFLDCLKGSVFSGRSKVKQEGSHPFMGHAKLLNKQISYLSPEMEWRSVRAKSLLWSRHYREAIGLSRAFASLPSVLGGGDMAVGRQLTIDDTSLQGYYLPYYYGMLSCEKEEFLIAQELLTGIFRNSGKGFDWDPLEVDLGQLFEGLRLYNWTDVEKELPPYASEMGFLAKQETANRLLGYLPLLYISAELTRRQAFLKWWRKAQPTKKPKLLTFSGRRVKEKHDEHWLYLREIVRPEKRPWDITDLKVLSKRFTDRVRPFYFRRDDPVFENVFFGQTSLYVYM